MDNGLVPADITVKDWMEGVLILIVVDNGLVLKQDVNEVIVERCLNPYCSGQWSRTIKTMSQITVGKGLNPYCSGQWSRTRPYKTLLIINKLKNFTKQIFTFLNRKLTIS